MFGTQTIADGIHFIGREIGHSAHPNAETPKRKHRRESRQAAISVQNLFGRIAADDEGVDDGLFAEELHTSRRMIGKRQFAIGRRMIEHAILAAGEVERDILVATTIVDALSVLVLELEGMSRKVHLGETLARADKAFVGKTFETHRSSSRLATTLDKCQGKGIITRRREMIVGREIDTLGSPFGNILALGTFGIELQVEGRLRSRLQVAPEFDDGFGTIERGAHLSIAIYHPIESRIFVHAELDGAYLLMPAHHIVLIDGFRAIERREYSDDIVGICLDDQREFALRNRNIGKHIILTHLTLIGNGDIYSAVTSFYTSGTIGFPKVLILLQGRVEVEEIE